MPSSSQNRSFALLSDYRRYDGKGNITQEVLGQGQTRVWTDTRNADGKLPNYRDLIRNGHNATTSLTGERTEIVATPGFIHSESRNSLDPINSATVWEANGFFVDGGLPTFAYPTDLSIAENQSLAKLWEAAHAQETLFKGMVFAGELRESLALLRSPFRKLRNGIGDYLRRLSRAGGRVAKRKRLSFVRDTWLEYSFGWKPLINDCDKAVTAFYMSDAVRPIFQMVGGRGYNKQETSTLSSYSVLYGMHQMAIRKTQTSESYVRHYGIYRLDGKGLSNAHTYGFSPSDFVPSLWELIPYSFLVDYFTNIGKVLESWSYRTTQLAWVSRGQKRVVAVTAIPYLRLSTQPLPNVATGHGFAGSYSYSRSHVVRTPSVPHSVPSLELRVPGRWTQWVNIVALTKSRDRARYVLNQ